MNIEIRAPIRGYLLSLWNVDCSAAAYLSTSQCRLALNNHAALYGVQNLSIAPGYATNISRAPYTTELNHQN